MRVTSTKAPREVFPSLPLPSSASLALLMSPLAPAPVPPSLVGWTSLYQLVALRGAGGGHVCPSPSPLPLPLLSPSPLPPLRLCPLCPLAPQIGQACCGCARVWPLCGPPPGGKLIIRATIAWAYTPAPGPSGLLGLLWNHRGLATMWAAPPRDVIYLGHNGPGLLFGHTFPH